MNNSKTILVVAAHPDDEILGCGATMAKLSTLGATIHIAIMGEGIAARVSSGEMSELDKKSMTALRAQAQKASQMVGAQSLDIFDFPDNRFDSVPRLDIVKKIETLIQRYRPDEIYTHHGADLNIDHRRVFEAVLIATRPIPGSNVKKVFAFEIPSSTEWAFQRVEPIFRPNTFVDVQESLEKKIQAMANYESEVRDFPHPRSTQALRAIAQKWGSVVGVHAAEAFELIRSIE